MHHPDGAAAEADTSRRGYIGLMARLKFNAHGFVFQDGMKVLLRSYSAAQDALGEIIDCEREAAFAYQQELEMGGKWIGEHDDEGIVIWDQEQILAHRVDEAEGASAALRKAFVITFYHHWERSALKWVGKGRLDHLQLEAAVRALGYPVDPALDDVRLLVNTLKHDNSKWGLQLWARRQGTFMPGFNPNAKIINWYESIRLKSDDVEMIWNIVACSGPTIKMVQPSPG